jgi:hypothetical protein
VLRRGAADDIHARLGHVLGRWSGSYPAARDLFALIVDVHRENGDDGPEHPDTLNARNQFAIWTGMAGDAAGARDQLAALLPVREQVLAGGCVGSATQNS